MVHELSTEPAPEETKGPYHPQAQESLLVCAAPPLYMPAHMTARSPLRTTRLLLLICGIALCTAGTALAQGVAVRAPTISRMCLWNADKAVWRALGVKRDQVQHLNVIRLRYPAVVQGQWMNEGDTVVTTTPDGGQRPLGSPLPTAQGMRAGPALNSGDNPFGPETSMERLGLQAELREVLSYEQLRLWEQLCNAGK